MVKDDFYINGKIVAATGLRDKALVSKSVVATDADGNLIDGLSGLDALYARLSGSNHPFTFVKTPNIRPASDSTTAIQITKADGTTSVLNVDTTNSRVGIGTTTPSALLDVGGSFTTPPTSVSTMAPTAYITSNTTGISGVVMGNAGTGTNSDYRFIIRDSLDSYIAFTYGGSARTSTAVLGLVANTYGGLFTTGAAANARHLLLATAQEKDLIFGTKNLERMRIMSDGEVRIPLDFVSGAAGSLSFGAAQDSEMGYNGTNFIINPAVVGTGFVRIQGNTVGEMTGLSLYNAAAPVSGEATTAVNISASIDNGSGVAIEAGKIVFGEEQSWTSTATRDSFISLHTRLNNVLAEKARVTSDGNVGIGTTAPVGKFDVSDGSLTIIGGADSGAITRTNATLKEFRMGVPHYTNAEEPAAIFLYRAEQTVNNLRLGGGSALLNSATEINFYTAANSTTTTGTVRMSINSAGNVGIGVTAPARKLDIYGSGFAQLKLKAELTDQAGGLEIFNDTGEYGKLEVMSSAFATVNQRDNTFLYAENDLLLGTGSRVERVRITNAGNVGIGTGTPLSQTTIQKTGAGATDVLGLQNLQAAGANVGSDLTVRGIGPLSQGSIRWAWDGAATTDAYTAFYTRGSNSNTEKMRITSAGNVGIGTITPTSILHINDASTTTDGVYIEKTSSINKTALDVNHKTSVSTRTIAKFRNLTGTAFEILGDGQMNAPLGNIYFGSGFSGQTTGKINVDFGADTSGTALSLRGNGPVIVQTIHRTTGTASATPLSRVQYTNDVTTNQQIAEFGVLANNNIGGTPQLRYMYMNPFATSSAWEGATLKVDFENRVGIGIAGTTRPTETLEVDGNLFLNGDNDKIYLGADKDEYLEYDPTFDGIQTAGKFKASEVRAIHKAVDGTASVADGTYTMGLGGTTNGTITIKDGVITAVQECVA
jgi:hypothetical protein